MKKVLFDEQARQDLSSQNHHHHFGKYYINTTRHRSIETFSQRSHITFCNKGWNIQNICSQKTYLDKKSVFSYLVSHTHGCRNPCQHDTWILEFRLGLSKGIMCWCFIMMRCVDFQEPSSAKLSKVINQEFAAIIAAICDLGIKILSGVLL